MQVGKLIEGRASSQIVHCTVDVTLKEAVRLLADKKIGAMPVMEHGKVVGIVSERDVLYCLAAEGEGTLSKPVREVMTSPAITITRDDECEEALGLMTRRRIRHLPVVEGDAMIGFVSIGDLVKTRIDEVSREASAMRDYIQMA
ncbi:CBS domain-containing protein [Qipengyuania sp.]|uniref:CBS domain-containing protein n=1 Tax=Qipengyuania sp. TaxID=2004515 RepID=UPI0035C84F83